MADSNDKDSANAIAFDELLKERRKDRLWRNIRFGGVMTMFALAITLRMLMTSDSFGDDRLTDDPYVAVVNLSGIIQPGDNMTSDEALKRPLFRAFSDDDAEGVAIRISSPGGTPVQSELIRSRIEDYKERFDRRVIIVAEEMLASGAYLVAMAGDEVYAQPATIVGSIGVQMSSFGFPDLMDQLGVERRVYTAGENKITMDPFQPEDQDAVDHTNTLLTSIHDQFIAEVRRGRGEKLNGSDQDLFNGLVWTGAQAVDLGLIDKTATMSEAIQKEFGTYKVVDYGPNESIWNRIGKFMQVTSQVLTGELTQPRMEAHWRGQ